MQRAILRFERRRVPRKERLREGERDEEEQKDSEREQQPVLQRVLAALLNLAMLEQHQRSERLLCARIARKAMQPQRQPHCQKSSQKEGGEERHAQWRSR